MKSMGRYYGKSLRKKQRAHRALSGFVVTQPAGVATRPAGVKINFLDGFEVLSLLLSGTTQSEALVFGHVYNAAEEKRNPDYEEESPSFVGDPRKRGFPPHSQG